MLRFACDSDQPGALLNTDFALTYSDLLTERILAALKSRLPGTEVLAINRGLGDPLDIATIIDVEHGALRPADCPRWFDIQQDRGRQYLTVYATAYTMGAVDAHMGQRSFWRWFASWGNGLAVVSHPAAMLQFASASMLGEHVDLSVIHDDNWHPRTRL